MALAILGAGCWGTALAVTLANNSPKEQIWLWGRTKYTANLAGLVLPSNLFFSSDLSLVLNNNQDLLIAVPSSAFTGLIQQISLHQCSSIVRRLVWATKGMDLASNKFFSEIVAGYYGNYTPMAVLSGPSFAQEVIDSQLTAVELAFDKKYFTFAQDIYSQLNSENFQICFSNDLMGVQLAGVFKNVVAVAAGISDGLGYGANTRSALIAKSMREILPLALALQADPQTFTGLAGIGDLILTCCNEQSRNRKFGRLLAAGYTVSQAKDKIGQTIESIDSIESMHRLASIHKIHMPIVNTMWHILDSNPNHGLASIIKALFKK